MLSTKSLIYELNEVPREWVFENYLKLNEQLTGQDIRIKSPFNSFDKNPSCYIYFSKLSNSYQFKDFSADKKGDGVNLVLNLFGLSTRGEAAHKILVDYNQFILVNGVGNIREFKVHSKYKVISFEKRKWTNVDAGYWKKFHISSKLLEHYHVYPLSKYKMEKDDGEHIHHLSITGSNFIYGYFRSDGSLYKIYQPMVKENKFIKIKDYIQGTDQLTYSTDCLVINSSLKDIMAFMSLNFKGVESVAPDSENTLIPEHIMMAYKLKYKNIYTLFDNDSAGFNARDKYNLKYGIPYLSIPLSKDISDSIKDHGVNKVKEILLNNLKLCTK